MIYLKMYGFKMSKYGALFLVFELLSTVSVLRPLIRSFLVGCVLIISIDWRRCLMRTAFESGLWKYCILTFSPCLYTCVIFVLIRLFQNTVFNYVERCNTWPITER